MLEERAVNTVSITSPMDTSSLSKIDSSAINLRVMNVPISDRAEYAPKRWSVTVRADAGFLPKRDSESANATVSRGAPLEILGESKARLTNTELAKDRISVLADFSWRKAD
eukprot:11127856-Ditylum_brightwellii.AAC.1